MVGNFNSVTAAPARTSELPVLKTDSQRAGTSLPGGKIVSSSGQPLPQTPPPPPVVDVDRAIERLNELMSGKQRSLRFQVDRGSGRTVITVINKTTKEIIRQIPPEELLMIARNLEQLGSMMNTWI